MIVHQVDHKMLLRGHIGEPCEAEESWQVYETNKHKYISTKKTRFSLDQLANSHKSYETVYKMISQYELPTMYGAYMCFIIILECSFAIAKSKNV